MRGFRTIAAVAGVLLLIIVIAALTAVFFAGAQSQELCVRGRCVVFENARAFASVGAIAGLMLVLLLRGKDAGAATGAGLVLLGFVAAIAVAPVPHFEIGEAQGGETASYSERMLRTMENAQRIQLPDDLVYEGDVQLSNGGLAALRFRMNGDARMQIDVKVIDGDENEADPAMDLFRVEGGARERIASNDDGGDDLNARIVAALVDGDEYIIAIRNINHNTLESGNAERLRVEIKPFVSRANRIPKDRTANLAIGGVFTFSGEVTSIEELVDEDFYVINLLGEAEGQCLIVEVKPDSPQYMFTGLFNSEEAFIKSASNRGADDEPAVMIAPLEGGAPQFNPLYLHVGAREQGAKYQLRVELRKRQSDGTCISEEAFRVVADVPAADVRNAEEHSAAEAGDE